MQCAKYESPAIQEVMEAINYLEEETMDGLTQAITHIKNAINDYNQALVQCQDYSDDMTKLQNDMQTIYDKISNISYTELSELLMENIVIILSDLQSLREN